MYNHCEKTFFLIEVLPKLGELVFLDSDLMIIKPAMMDRLYFRSRAHDFLASHAQKLLGSSYFCEMNSGLFFMRWLPNLNYSEMGDIIREKKAIGDQIVLTTFVHRRYENWDTLSVRWHCRYLKRWGFDVPQEACYTIHDRHERREMLKSMNISKLKV